MDPQLEQNSQFLVNWVHIRENDDVTSFLTLKKRNTWNLSFLGSLSKHGHQKHTAWILWDQKLRYFIIVMFLLTEISTFSEPDCYT